MYGDEACCDNVAAPVVVADGHAPGIPPVLVCAGVGDWAIVLKDGVGDVNG